MTGTTIQGADNSDTIHFVGGQNTVVFGSAIGTAAQVSFGTGNDMATFNGAISAGSIYGGTGADTSTSQVQLHLVQRLIKVLVPTASTLIQHSQGQL